MKIVKLITDADLRAVPTAWQIQTLEKFMNSTDAKKAFEKTEWAWGKDGLTIYAKCTDGFVEIHDNEVLNIN